MRLFSKLAMPAAVLAFATLLPAQAEAIITLTPADADCSAPGPGQPNNGPSQDEEFLEDFCNVDPNTLTLLYKEGEAGSTYNNSYNTTTDGTNATITYDGGGDPSIDCGECWLVVKDGNANPGWYGFDISDWNGTETIQLNGFFTGTGAISHISIWGIEGGGDGPGEGPGDGPGEGPTPEPASLLLFGLALTGAGMRLRRARA